MVLWKDNKVDNSFGIYDGEKKKETQMYNVRDKREGWAREREYDPKYGGGVDMMVCAIFMPMHLKI